MLKRIITSAVLLLASLSTANALELHITEGSSLARPIAIAPFKWEGKGNPPQSMNDIVAADLQNSGQFSPLKTNQLPESAYSYQDLNFSKWNQKGLDAVVVGSISKLAGDNYQIHYQLLDTVAGELAQKSKKKQNGDELPSYVLLDETLSVPGNRLREQAHRISDAVYEKLTGQKGAFLTRIAFVARLDGGSYPYQLKVSDYDGYNERIVLRSRQPFMSPTWSPDGRYLAYVSFESGRSKLYLLDVYSGKKEVLTEYQGHNGAPKFSPDGKSLAMVLSKTGRLQVYILDLASRKIKQITQGGANNTEPSWYPDAQSLVFTSDRGGAPQLYKVDLNTLATERLTWEGSQNLSGQITPDGKNLIMVHRSAKGFNIASQELETGTVLILTSTQLDESPSVAPNGSMIIYSTMYGKRNVLSLVSVDGRFQARLPMKNGRIKSPSWSSFYN